MQQAPHRSGAERRERGPEPRDDRDAPRIPQLRPSRAMFAASANERAADGLLGLLASHADKQLPLLDQRELLRRRQQLPGNPRPVMSLEAAASAMHPTGTLQHQEQERPRADSSSFTEDKPALASPLLAFLSRSSKCGSPRLPVNVTSPRSVWEESPPNERLDPTASPRHTTASTSRLVPTPPTTSSWRIHTLLSPDPTTNVNPPSSHKRRTPPSSPQEQMDVATKRPRLARRVSSQWRQELLPRDRAKTRERIMHALHMHCQGDYEKIVLLLSSLEEELLHIKTTSTEFYTQQAFDLSDLIEHATLER
ncbi:hypothetical protein PRNP1_002501 [Phytophthora ramorum]